MCAWRHLHQPVTVLVSGTDKPLKCILGEKPRVIERGVVVSRTVEQHALRSEILAVNRHRLVHGAFGGIEREVSTGRVAGEEHTVFVQMERVGMQVDIIDSCGTVGQLIGDVKIDTIYQAVFE